MKHDCYRKGAASQRDAPSRSQHYKPFKPLSCVCFLQGISFAWTLFGDVCMFEIVVEQLPYNSDRYSVSVFLTSSPWCFGPADFGVWSKSFSGSASNPKAVRWGEIWTIQVCPRQTKKLLHLLPSDFAGAIDKDASDVSKWKSFVILFLASGGCRFPLKTW